MKLLLLLVAAAALAACTEKTQTLQSGVRSDTPAFQGPASVYTVGGWKPGDRTSWDLGLKTRAQFQNEYNKVN